MLKDEGGEEEQESDEPAEVTYPGKLMHHFLITSDLLVGYSLKDVEGFDGYAVSGPSYYSIPEYKTLTQEELEKLPPIWNQSSWYFQPSTQPYSHIAEIVNG